MTNKAPGLSSGTTKKSGPLASGTTKTNATRKKNMMTVNKRMFIISGMQSEFFNHISDKIFNSSKNINIDLKQLNLLIIFFLFSRNQLISLPVYLIILVKQKKPKKKIML